MPDQQMEMIAQCKALLHHAENAGFVTKEAGPFYASSKNICERLEDGTDQIVATWRRNKVDVHSIKQAHLERSNWGVAMLAAVYAVNHWRTE